MLKYLALALLIASDAAQASTLTMSIIINSPASVAVACQQQPATLVAPVAAGATICPITVTPTGWSGVLSLSGPDAAKFALSGSNLTVGPAALGAGTYSVTITATP